MEMVIVLLAFAAAALLFLLLLQRYEIKHITRQLREIAARNTNEFVHTLGADGAGRELINEINHILDRMRGEGIRYRKKKHDMEMMLTNIAHDLRTPLTSAIGYVGLMRSGEIPQKEQEQELAVVEQRLFRLEELISSFFEFSRVITEDRQPEMEWLPLTALLEEAIAQYYDDYCDSGRMIHLEKGAKKCMVYSNRNLLMRVFENLISNGFKHGKGSLFVEFDSTDKIRIRFRNELKEELDVNRIFDEFYTTDISRSKGNTGLGLAIARQFTRMLGGRISAKADGGSLVITVELPKENKAGE